MRKNIQARRYLLTSDAAIALSAAFGDSPGVIVISGTGSIAYGRDAQGLVWRVGGWGIPYDDCGSGYEIGREAVAAALRAFDGRGTRTQLSALICRNLNLKSIDEIVSRQLVQQEIAALFPLVVKAASAGDRAARDICNFAAQDLAALAIPLLKKMASKNENARMVVTGGVFESSLMICNAFKRSLRSHFPSVRVELLNRAPVEGALWLARNSGPKKT
jgi:N-acetylglucosamine kinase-like BadF-type ATPase